jgi:hypothetical protein
MEALIGAPTAAMGGKQTLAKLADYSIADRNQQTC